MTLKDSYTNFLHQATNSNPSLLKETKTLSRNDLKESDNWYKALAVLEHAALSLPEAKDDIFDLYTRLITEGLDFKASVHLNDEDYDFHFNNLVRVLGLLAPHFPVIYSQIGFQYREARGPHRNIPKVIEYLDKAAGLDVEVAIAVKGYFLYYGVLYEQDQEKGLKLLNSTDSEWNRLYKGYMSLNNKELEGIPGLIAELKESTDRSIRKNTLVFEGHYLDSQEDLQGAIKLYQELIETYHSDFAMCRLGALKLFESNTEETKEKAFVLWKDAFELGTIDAVNHLGYHSLPENSGNTSYDQSIYWFEKGHLYHNAFSSFRLAMIYLYSPEQTDTAKGMFYLDEAIKNDSSDALLEKAEILLEGSLVDKDEKEALAIFSKAAEKKLPYAMNKLAYFYESGQLIADAPDVETAITYYEEAAGLNFPSAINNAGRIYRYGLLGTADPLKAQEYFEKGASLKIPYSLTELAFMYEDGTIGKDYQKSFDLFNEAAELNYPFAMHTTGTYLENGYHNQTPNPEAAFQWYLKGAELNDTNCIFETGRCYRFGAGVEENPDQALAYYRKAAEAGSAKAMVELGLCYEYEYGVEFDAQKAFDYMQQAAELGYYYGEYKLGYYYMHGLIEQDTQKALEWLGKAADAGYPHAMLQIGDYYMYDYDGLDEAEKAFDYYQKAQEQGVVSEGLGLCYEYGIGVETDLSEAFKYYEMAANNNYVVAKYHTGRCYLNGFGVKANEETAFRWFHDAAQNDNVAAQYYTGTLLLQGKGTAMNKEEGIEWLNRAAGEDYPSAQFELGNCYLMGDGVEENEDTAMYWFELAADNGHEKAMKLTGRKKGK